MAKSTGTNPKPTEAQSATELLMRKATKTKLRHPFCGWLMKVQYLKMNINVFWKSKQFETGLPMN